MTLEITYWNSDFRDGKLFNVPGLGVFPNGYTVEITPERERAFVARTKKSVRESLGDDFTVVGKSSINVV